jgi:predicted metal-dependent HD superfamily phosphohydrolase
LAEDGNLDPQDVEDLVVAAAFHDIGYSTNPLDHEAVSADIAESFLQSEGLSDIRRNNIKEYILATKLDWTGHNRKALYLRDGDLSGLAAPNFHAANELLRIELNSIGQNKFDKNEWIDENIRFFESHAYLTTEAQHKYDKAKKRNLKSLIKAKKATLQDGKFQTIASSRTAQTQLKTALRNHIDLSSIADNKSNIMLSINAIVITVGLPLMANQMNNNKNYIYPIIILALSSLISMLYAMLATRPIHMNGLTDLGAIEEKKTNLFFFGNFYKMKFNQYEEGIKKVIENDELLENSITRDLFFLGRSLGTKFAQLRICYNTFMIGMLLTVLAFVAITIIAGI